MTVLPNHFFKILASGVMVNMTENARRSWPGVKLHNCSLRAGGQHRDGTLHQVDAGCALASITIQGGVRLDEVRDVGDVHTDVVRTILVDLDRQSIVEVLRGIRVDGEGTLPTEVLAGL